MVPSVRYYHGNGNASAVILLERYYHGDICYSLMHCSTTNTTDSSSISTMRNAESEQSSMSSALNSFPALPVFSQLIAVGLYEIKIL